DLREPRRHVGHRRPHLLRFGQPPTVSGAPGTPTHDSRGRRYRAVATRVSLRTLCRRTIGEHAGWTVFDVAEGLRSGLLVPRCAARYPVRAVRAAIADRHRGDGRGLSGLRHG